MAPHPRRQLEQELSDCNNPRCTHHQDNRSSNDSSTLPHRTHPVYLSNPGKHRTRKFTNFAVCSIILRKKLTTFALFLRKNKLKFCSAMSNCASESFIMSFLNVVPVQVARFQFLSPLVDRRVNDVLLQTIPDMNEALLQLIHVIQTAFAVTAA